MSQIMQYTFRLFGPRKGQTVSLNGHPFIDGVCRMNGAPEHMGFVMKALGYYGAFAMGTAEYDKALKLEQETESDGADKVQESSEPGTADSNVSQVQPGGGEPAKAETDDSAGDDDTEEGSAGLHSKGDGHSDSRIPDFSEASTVEQPSEPVGEADKAVHTAVMKLDPENDEHWTKAGIPALSAVEDALGKAGVTRKDVEAAAPGWTRDKALEKAVADL